jgi:hypothetical protein
MESQPATGYECVPEVLERVFDKGIVLDPWIRASCGEIELLNTDARIVVASVTPSDPAPSPASDPVAPAPPP